MKLISVSGTVDLAVYTVTLLLSYAFVFFFLISLFVENIFKM